MSTVIAEDELAVAFYSAPTIMAGFRAICELGAKRERDRVREYVSKALELEQSVVASNVTENAMQAVVVGEFQAMLDVVLKEDQ